MINNMRNKQTLDYYNSIYKPANKNFNLQKYKNLVLKEHSDILNKNKKILDVGCGAGFLLNALECEDYKNLTGVELDKNQYLEAKKHLKFSKLFNQDCIEFLNKTEERYDIIFLYDLLEHIPKEKIIRLLKLIYKSLNNKGVLVIKTPNADSPYFASRMRYGDFTHETSFNKESVETVLREAGFSNIICKSTKFPFSLKSLGVYPIRLLGNIILRIYMISYIGLEALNIILTPNFIIIAKK
jgi:2-polyprenyl-3-methyl-5-hydroxy-6-metoxy-1,4-benzoquinol methylase